MSIRCPKEKSQGLTLSTASLVIIIATKVLTECDYLENIDRRICQQELKRCKFKLLSSKQGVDWIRIENIDERHLCVSWKCWDDHDGLGHLSNGYRIRISKLFSSGQVMRTRVHRVSWREINVVVSWYLLCVFLSKCVTSHLISALDCQQLGPYTQIKKKWWQLSTIVMLKCTSKPISRAQWDQ